MSEITAAAIRAEWDAKVPVMAYLASHEPLDWPNVRAPRLVALAERARQAEQRGDLPAVRAAWAAWLAGVQAQVPGEML